MEKAEKREKPSGKQLGVALALMVGSYLAFQLCNMVMKLNQELHEASGPETYYYMSLFKLPLFSLVLKLSKQDPLEVRPDMRIFVLLRVLAGGMTNCLLFIAFQFTAFSKATTILFTNSLLLPFFAYLLNKEPIQKSDVAGILLAFAGMLLVVQPFQAPTDNHWHHDLFGCSVAFLSSITYALAVVFIQKLSKAGVHFTINCFIDSFGGLLASPILLFFFPRIQLPEYGAPYFLLALGSALFYFLAIISFNYAIRFLTGGTVGIIMYLSIPISLIFDVFLFQHEPNHIELAGMAIIFSVNIIMSILKIKGIVA